MNKLLAQEKQLEQIHGEILLEEDNLKISSQDELTKQSEDSQLIKTDSHLQVLNLT